MKILAKMIFGYLMGRKKMLSYRFDNRMYLWTNDSASTGWNWPDPWVIWERFCP